MTYDQFLGYGLHAMVSVRNNENGMAIIGCEIDHIDGFPSLLAKHFVPSWKRDNERR